VIKLSANLGFLWLELPLPERILAAGRAGFDAVECHAPYQWPADEVAAALSEAEVPLVSLNTRTGGVGDFGLGAIPGRETEMCEYIDEALAYAQATGCPTVHIVAGVTAHLDRKACEAVLCANLTHASDAAVALDKSIVIEPMSRRAVPGAHLGSLDQGIDTVTTVGRDNVKILADLFHLQIQHGDLTERMHAALPMIGHIQFAAVPDRHEPDHGELDFAWLLPELVTMGYDGCFGAEYRPRTTTDEGLGWMSRLRNQTSQPDFAIRPHTLRPKRRAMTEEEQ